MGFEGFFKSKPKQEKTPEQEAEDKKQRNAKIALGASVVALGGVIAELPSTPDLHSTGDAPKPQAETIPGSHGPMQMDGKGTMVELKDGQAVVTMAPPGDEKPVEIDYRKDPNHQVHSMRAPE
jgi:hypothetical protein